MNTKQTEEQLKHLFENWKSSLEDMRVQFALGKMDAAETFEKQKKQLRTWVDTLKKNTDEAGDMAEAQFKQLRAKLEELNLQLNLGKAETKDLFEAQRKKIDLAIHDVIAAGKKAYHGNYAYMMDLFENQSKAIKTGLEIAQLQFALGKMNASDEMAQLRKDIQHKIADLQHSAEKARDLTRENMEEWNRQMRDGMEKMQGWISGWLQGK